MPLRWSMVKGRRNMPVELRSATTLGLVPVNFACVLVWCALDRKFVSGAGRPGTLQGALVIVTAMAISIQLAIQHIGCASKWREVLHHFWSIQSSAPLHGSEG
jgi:hypothetical protein